MDQKTAVRIMKDYGSIFSRESTTAKLDDGWTVYNPRFVMIKSSSTGWNEAPNGYKHRHRDMYYILDKDTDTIVPGRSSAHESSLSEYLKMLNEANDLLAANPPLVW